MDDWHCVKLVLCGATTALIFLAFFLPRTYFYDFQKLGGVRGPQNLKTNMNNPGRNCTVDCPVIISRLWLLFTSKCFMWRGSSVIIVEKIGQTGPQQCPFVTMHWVRWMTQRHMAFISAHWTADFFRKLLLSSRSRGSMIRPGFTRFTHKYDESCQKKNRHCVTHQKKSVLFKYDV